MSLGGRPDAPRATCSTQKPCLYGIPSWQWQKSWMSSRKNWFGAKKLHFWAVLGLKIRFFLRYANLTPLVRLRRTRLNGIITSPCPEVTLDNFNFPVGARSAAHRAVFWHQLQKMALFWLKTFYRTQVSWSDLCVWLSVTEWATFVKLYWCDSGWWRYKLDTNW